MSYNPAYGPAAQTCEQRARVLRQMQVTFPSLRANASAYTQQLYERYVAGELSWQQVRQALDAIAAR
jgi:hypothetical protein